jgi:hypothetical protein
MNLKKISSSFFLLLAVVLISACNNDDPSVLKVFVRSNSNVLTPNATVRIVGDISEGTPEYFDERKTNSQGIAFFDLEEHFDAYSKGDDKVAYYTVYARDTSAQFTKGNARAKAHITSTEKIILDN